jgi:hypothetical protein
VNAKHRQSAEKKALADTLLEHDCGTATSTAEARALAERVLRRDRLRVRVLTGATILLFLLTVVGIYWNFHLAKTEIYSKIFECNDQVFRRDITPVEAQILVLLTDAYMLQFKSILATLVAFGAILVAAVCTILLVLATRRATFRQIRVSLRVLSEQIETMRQSVQTGDSSGSSEAAKKPDAG